MAVLDLNGRPMVAAAPQFRPQAMIEAGSVGRRLRAIPVATRAINNLIRSYGASLVSRSRYLAINNSYAAAAREAFVSSMVGTGIVPSFTVDDPLKSALRQAFEDWTDEADADWLTDFYGMQAIVAGEIFEAGECFVRMRHRLPEDGLSVPLQLQLIPSEMCPLSKNEDLGQGRRVECGIEFNAIGKRTAYHFYRVHPGTDQYFGQSSGQTVAVPADEVIHIFRPIRAGQIRGLPHTLAAITTLAILDLYDDAELERKRMTALFAAFIRRPASNNDDFDNPLGPPIEPWLQTALSGPGPALEPGATIDLDPGEEVTFSEPADVGAQYEPFQYRQLLRVACGFGVPYADMTGDLKQANYGSIRAGLITFRRRIRSMQHSMMVYKLCREVSNAWLEEATLAGAVDGLTPRVYQTRLRDLRRIKWQPPAWEWIDPEKDLRAEKLAIGMNIKPRSRTIEETGEDPAEVDKLIVEDEVRMREERVDAGLTPEALDPNKAPAPGAENAPPADGSPPAPAPAKTAATTADLELYFAQMRTLIEDLAVQVRGED